MDRPTSISEHFDQENFTFPTKRHPGLSRRALGNLDCNSMQTLQTSDCTRMPKLSALHQPNRPGSNPNNLETQTGSTVGSALVSRRNERERNRVRLLNMGFDRLRAVVPSHPGEQLSKISTLKKAIWYIEHLDRVLHGQIEPPPSVSRPAATAVSSTLVAESSSNSFSLACDNGGIIYTGVAGVGTGATSWSFLDNMSGVHLTREGRPEQQLSSPIFPSRWESRLANDIIASTTKSTQRWPGQTRKRVKYPVDYEYQTVGAKHKALHSVRNCWFATPLLVPQQQSGSFDDALYSEPNYFGLPHPIPGDPIKPLPPTSHPNRRIP